MPGDTFFPELFAEAAGQSQVARDITRFEHRGFCKHVLVCQGDRFGNRAGRMADLEANVPQQIENLFHHFRGIRRDARAAFIVEEHHVHVAKGIELAAAVTAERDHSQRRNSLLFRRKARHQCKNMTQHDIE